MIHVAGANPNGGGVLTYIKNLTHSMNDLYIYAYTEYLNFFRNIQDGDIVFLNVVKPSLPFLILAKLKFNKNITIVYCGHGLNYKNNKGFRRHIVKFCEYFISKFSDKIIVLNKKDMSEFLSWNESSYLIPTSLRPNDNLKRKTGKIDGDISWVAVGCVEERKNPALFVEIARSIKRLFPNDSFTWIGDGPLFRDFNTESLKNEGIFFKGAMDNDLVRDKLNQHHIFLCTSSFEVLPISILEAVEARCIICLNKYHYSDDVTSRFSSAVSFDNSNQVVDIRKNIDKLVELNKAAIYEANMVNKAYKSYIKSMKKVLDV